jgi:hypothetical protein
MSNTFEIVKSIINEWDAYKLIQCGAPDDEFDAEILDITERVKHIHSPEDAAYVIATVFTYYFGKGFEPSASDCLTVGEKLYLALKSKSLRMNNK